ncbi:MAG: hypothetical protein ASARMPREDX12_005198 [Alectoria sarmentosa]|nr:MAG: hypothetical protein ASARMPREDX12_005198 [Alectoria sarmentosa]
MATAPRSPLTLQKSDLSPAAPDDDEMDGIEVPHGDEAEDEAEEGEGKMEGVEGTNTGTEIETGDESEMQDVEEKTPGKEGEMEGGGFKGREGRDKISLRRQRNEWPDRCAFLG